jgi:hypothetical protein
VTFSATLSQASENSSVALALPLKSWEEIQRIAENLSAATASSQEASRMCGQILEIRSLILTMPGLANDIEQMSQDLKDLKVRAQGRISLEPRAYQATQTNNWGPKVNILASVAV